LVGTQVEVLDDLVPETEIGVINLDNCLYCLLLLFMVLHCGSAVPKGKLLWYDSSTFLKMPPPKSLSGMDIRPGVLNSISVAANHEKVTNEKGLSDIEIPKERSKRIIWLDKEDLTRARVLPVSST